MGQSYQTEFHLSPLAIHRRREYICGQYSFVQQNSMQELRLLLKNLNLTEGKIDVAIEQHLKLNTNIITPSRKEITLRINIWICSNSDSRIRNLQN